MKTWTVKGRVTFDGSCNLNYTVRAETEEEAIDMAFGEAIDWIEIDTSGLVATEAGMETIMRLRKEPTLGI